MDTTEPAKANGKPYIPGRQRGKIPDEEWAEIQRYRTGLKKQLADVEAAIKREEHAAREVSAKRAPAIFGYVRVSHQDSKDSGLGEDGQKRIVERWAAIVRDEYKIEGPIRWNQEKDAVSAFKKQLILRDAGGTMNIELRQGDHVIFAYLDRAFRNTEDCLGTLRTWKARGIIVHFANLHVDMNTPQGELLVAVMAACAQMDSAMKSERIKEVFAGFPAMGRMSNGRAPMGFKLSGKRGKRRVSIPDPEQRRIMGEIVRVRDKYNWSFDKISDYVDEWLAATEGRQQTPRWTKREWPTPRCRRAYYAECALRGVKVNAPRYAKADLPEILMPPEVTSPSAPSDS